MTDEGEKDRLLAQAYSRASAREDVRAYVDPDTGDNVLMRPSEWRLRTYERRMAAAARSLPRDAPEGLHIDEASPEQSDTTLQRLPSHLAVGPRLLHSPLAAGVGVIAAVLLGFLIGSHVEELTGATVEAAGDDPAASSEPPPPPVEAIERVFEDPAYRAVRPGRAVTAGFQPDSFRLVGASMLAAADDAVQIYAARRGGSRYCLVVAAAGVQVASACGTAREIGETGLLIERPLVGDLVPRGTQIVVEWLPSGALIWRTSPLTDGRS